jgi:hypothetical protein
MSVGQHARRQGDNECRPISKFKNQKLYKTSRIVHRNPPMRDKQYKSATQRKLGKEILLVTKKSVTRARSLEDRIKSGISYQLVGATAKGTVIHQNHVCVFSAPVVPFRVFV